jgi:tRNA 2-thiouridine synthesizing protein E
MMATLDICGKQLEVDADNHLVNNSDWSEEVAAELARQEGIEELTENHWKVINFLRSEFGTNNQLPSIRAIGKRSGVNTKDFYQLFPQGPGKKSARIAGLPKPKSCV